ncbi:uncharacterized protein [Linepithema humile]|uniref:uncharacterized protein n=1 Tax=Linepithema humile TaxID=83485 RepID=UPI00062340B8|nr:PREDICTED: uncharacterized protein LOC105667911 [Linepithema humile]
MKLLLFTSVVCFAAVLAAPADKQKREILPGDPRYGTDYQHHHHHEHENDVQISKAAGGYVGSYAVHDENQSGEAQPQPHSAYGPPNHQVGQLLGSDFLTNSDSAKAIAHVPATSYGIPDTQVINNNFLEGGKLNAVVKTVHEHPTYDVVQKSVIPEVHQPAVVHKHVETVSVPQVKVTTSHLPVQTQGVVQHSVPSVASSIKNFPSYSYPSYSNIPLKTIDHHVHVQVPQPYPVPVTKHVSYPIPVPHRVEVPKPYYVRVPQPVQVAVNRPYPVEVPRPVPYVVPHYVRTSGYPVIQQHGVIVDANRASSNPFQGFFENAQFQNVLANFPNFQNPLEGFQNSFENFELPSFPNLPSFPSLPSFFPSQQPSQPANNAPSSADTVAVDNLALKVEKPKVLKPATTCAGCSVGAVNGGSASASAVSSVSSGAAVATKQDQLQEHVQSTDANGGYVY